MRMVREIEVCINGRSFKDKIEIWKLKLLVGQIRITNDGWFEIEGEDEAENDD